MSAIGIAGSKIFMATVYGAAKTFSSISNAAEAVLSFAADPALVEDDIFELSSAWGEASGNVYRAKSPSGAGPYLVTAENFDSQSTTLFPAAGGAGTIREASSFVQITQVKDEGGITSGGGELTYNEYGFLEVGRRVRQPDVRGPSSLKVICYDDNTLGWYASVKAAAQNRGTPYVFYILLPSGAKLYFSAYVSMKEVPDFADYLETSIDLDLLNTVIRYAA